MCRGNNGNQIFYNDTDYLKYLELIGRYKNEHPFDLFHYCLMSNHVHLLAMVKDGKDFSNFMKRLNLSYFKYYQSNYGWNGHFWQDRFKSKYISQDAYLLQCGKYIELNPVRARIVDDPCDYNWSSYKYYTKNQENYLITKDLFFDSLGQSSEDRAIAYGKMIVSEIFSFDNKLVAQGNIKEVYNANRRYSYHKEHKESPYRKS